MKHVVRKGWAAAPQFSKPARVPPSAFQFPALSLASAITPKDPYSKATAFEIVITYFQFVSALFPLMTASVMSSVFWRVYGPIVRVFTLYFEDIVPIFFNRVWIFVLSSIVVLVGTRFLISCRRMKHDRDEIEPIQSEESLVASTHLQLLLSVITFLYCPAARLFINIVTKSPLYFGSAVPAFSLVHLTSLAAATIMLFSFLILVPMTMRTLVARHRPKFDLSLIREQSDFVRAEERYVQDLLADDHPLKPLYGPYAMTASQTKSGTMIKLGILIVLITAAINYTTPPTWQPTSALRIVSGIVVISIIGRYAVVGLSETRYNTPEWNGLALQIRMGLLGLYLVALANITLTSLEILIDIIVFYLTCRTIYQLSSAMFSTTYQFMEAQQARNRRLCTLSRDNVTKEVRIFDRSFNIEHDRKMRIWIEFWALNLVDGDGSPLISNANSTLQAAQEASSDINSSLFNKADYTRVANIGIPSLRQRIKANQMHESTDVNEFQTLLSIGTVPAAHESMLFLMRYLQGPNVYWPREGNCQSVTKFGTLHVCAHPLRVELHYEDCDQIAAFDIVHDAIDASMSKIQDLIALNYSRDILQRRRIRSMLKALDGFTCRTTFREKLKDQSTGELIAFDFRNGVIRMTGSAGASPRLSYRCQIEFTSGTGVDSSGVEHAFVGKHVVALFDLGISPDITLDRSLLTFLYDNWFPNSEAVSLIMSHEQGRLDDLRAAWIRYYYQRKHSILSNEFWCFVYNNDTLSQSNLRAILQEESSPGQSYWDTDEQLDMIRKIGDIDMLYQKLHYFDSDPGVSFWFCFWHDLWVSNHDATNIGAHPQLDCYNSGAIAYRPVPETELMRTMSMESILASQEDCEQQASFLDVLDNIRDPPTRRITYDTITRLYRRMTEIELTNDAPKLKLGDDAEHYIPAPIERRRDSFGPNDGGVNGINAAANAEIVAAVERQAGHVPAKPVQTFDPAGKPHAIRQPLFFDDAIVGNFRACRAFLDRLVFSPSTFDAMFAAERASLFLPLTIGEIEDNEAVIGRKVKSVLPVYMSSNGANVALHTSNTHKENQDGPMIVLKDLVGNASTT